jgi:hypothetical protein
MESLWNGIVYILPFINFVLLLTAVVLFSRTLLRKRLIPKRYKLERKTYTLEEAEESIKQLEGCIIDGERVVDYSIQEVPGVKFDIAVEFEHSYLTFSFPMQRERE